MRKIRDVLRLSAAGMSKRKIAASLGMSATAAGECIQRARRAGLTWPVPEGLTDEALEARLYRPPTVGAKRRPQPDWAAVHRELRRPGVTLQLLWEEHRAAYPDGYGYSRYCELYGAWAARLSPTMRQSHVAGERMFVDYAGTTLEVMDGSTGEVLTAQLFVASLGATNYTYAEATWTQGLSDWIGSHTRAFAFIGGVPAVVVSDNLRSGVTKACFYEPTVNRTYAEMAAHYNTAIVPARPYRARDKAKVEVAVQIATRFIVAKLRNRQFFSLCALNVAIAELVAQLNNRVSRHLGASRRALFDEIERAALKPLPAEPYVFAEWKECRVALDYHVEIEKHYYSVPHQLLREKVWARITARTIEVFHCGKRVAAHVRSSSDRKHTTVREHMPSSHRRYADWTPERLRRSAAEIGRRTSALIATILRERTHPEQGFRACVGILRLAKTYGRERLEAACGRALEIGARSYSSVNSILKNNLDRQQPATPTDGPAIAHDNIRGPTYFH
ncbi:IS21 family transposase [Bradyrhizobium sp. sBnM-33]|uniref:IS21 family transposase n=3 Tax=Bradyrhizobium TaxID=374 RepID=UPI00293E7859|nr:IS21 family transposase [Bradyrhizobium sp. sBnM-33]WOH52613.1 IS21 family transposase [Bradyrhizobium sp. sBnM-33]WOH52637.1 IS21 family transposase [Bradyrhizobium sp. sBnM-33]WOH53715.1 IS21 family transposase [Bradyrhizobium sp. sBnM-33]